jgi:hypothetical protein
MLPSPGPRRRAALEPIFGIFYWANGMPWHAGHGETRARAATPTSGPRPPPAPATPRARCSPRSPPTSRQRRHRPRAPKTDRPRGPPGQSDGHMRGWHVAMTGDRMRPRASTTRAHPDRAPPPSTSTSPRTPTSTAPRSPLPLARPRGQRGPLPRLRPLERHLVQRPRLADRPGDEPAPALQPALRRPGDLASSEARPPARRRQGRRREPARAPRRRRQASASTRTSTRSARSSVASS